MVNNLAHPVYPHLFLVYLLHMNIFRKSRKREINRRIGSTRILTDNQKKKKIESAQRTKQLSSPEIQ